VIFIYAFLIHFYVQKFVNTIDFVLSLQKYGSN